MDQIRALTFLTPASFRVVDVPIMLSNGHTFPETYNSLLMNTTIQVDGLIQDDKLLLLFGILADIICLQRDLGPMLRADMCAAKHPIPDNRGENRSENRPQEQGLLQAKPYVNPYLPNSPTARYSEGQRALSRGLKRWQSLQSVESVQLKSQSKQETFGGSDLACFCQMLLSAEPGVVELASRVGFTTSTNFQVVPHVEEIVLPKISDETLGLAWKTLDAIEKSLDLLCASSSQSQAPIWSPIVCFITGLVVWSGAYNSPGRERSQVLPRLRSCLKLFEVQLTQMGRPATRAMLHIIRSLREKD